MYDNLRAAATAWDVSKEDMPSVNRRIHDGEDGPQLITRAQRYVSQMRERFPYIDWNIGQALEIGSGTGFIMEALEHYTRGSPPPLLARSLVSISPRRCLRKPSSAFHQIPSTERAYLGSRTMMGSRYLSLKTTSISFTA